MVYAQQKHVATRRVRSSHRDKDHSERATPPSTTSSPGQKWMDTVRRFKRATLVKVDQKPNCALATLFRLETGTLSQK